MARQQISKKDALERLQKAESERWVAQFILGKVARGTLPDFEHRGRGVRVALYGACRADGGYLLVVLEGEEWDGETYCGYADELHARWSEARKYACLDTPNGQAIVAVSDAVREAYIARNEIAGYPSTQPGCPVCGVTSELDHLGLPLYCDRCARRKPTEVSDAYVEGWK